MSTRTEDRQVPPLPFTLRKKRGIQEICFSCDPDDNYMISIEVFRIKPGSLVRTHTIIRPDLDQWLNRYLDNGWTYKNDGRE